MAHPSSPLNVSNHGLATKCALSSEPLAAEQDEEGNVEYKLQILPTSLDRFDRLTTQLYWRLSEGGGTCVYELGVRDDGALIGISLEEMRKSLANLCSMAHHVGADVMLQRVLVKSAQESNTASFRFLTSTEEVVELLEIDSELPSIEYPHAHTPQNNITIQLAGHTPPPLLCNSIPNNDSLAVPTYSNAIPVPIPTPTLMSMPSSTDELQREPEPALVTRRDRRVARYQATILAGAGLGEMPKRADIPRNMARSPHTPTSNTEQFLVEAVLTQTHERFVDYSAF